MNAQIAVVNVTAVATLTTWFCHQEVTKIIATIVFARSVTNHLLIASVNVKVLDGKAKTMTQWAEELGLSRETIRGRLRRGATVERALR